MTNVEKRLEFLNSRMEQMETEVSAQRKQLEKLQKLLYFTRQILFRPSSQENLHTWVIIKGVLDRMDRMDPSLPTAPLRYGEPFNV